MKNIFRKILKRGNSYARFSYSQCGEDLLIDFIFKLKKIKRPTYLDIGAHHPWFISNTALLNKSGSRGINVEPNPELFKAFLRERMGDTNLNIGVSRKAGELDFYFNSESWLGTFSKNEADNFSRLGRSIKKTEKIKVLSLQEIIDKYANGKFPDFLNIDVEGSEAEILKDFDFSVNYPKVICVETAKFSPDGLGDKRVDLMHLIEAKGYFLYADTHLNSIYVKREFLFGK